MHKLLPVLILSFYSLSVSAQQDFFVLKKGNTTLTSYRVGFYIAFQTKNKEWITGDITRIRNDSFMVRPRIIQVQLMRTDTFYFPIMSLALTDVVILPKKGVKIDYINGQNRINTSAGHVHWYWIKSGLLFRAGGAGFALLGLVNGLSANLIALGAGIFILGELLHRAYKLTMKLGKKYHLQLIKISH
jgi:hypothetical protein